MNEIEMVLRQGMINRKMIEIKSSWKWILSLGLWKRKELDALDQEFHELHRKIMEIK